MAMSNEYSRAQKMAQRCYQKYLLEGRYPYLPVLDELLSHTEIVAEVKLGRMAIPSELIVGTYAAGRRTAFAPNFMPLLETGTEFESKWSNLCEAHLNEGIRDPIKCYEFMNRYYVIEGNKRVSVLKYFNAVTIPGNVTRLIPKRTEERENRVYFEYLDFYRHSNVNFIIFTEPGSYKMLLDYLGFAEDYDWTDDDRMNVRSYYIRFEKAYKEKAGENPKVPTADAMLVYMDFYPYNLNEEKLAPQIKEEINKIWDEIQLKSKDQAAEIMTEPSAEPKKNIFDFLNPFGSSSKKLKIAFIHDKTAQTSSWTYGHELGRMYIEERFAGRVETICYDNILPGESLENAFDSAINQKCDIIFTTTPQFLEASTKRAIDNPDIKILNCSVDTTHKCVRTYYARLYEGKFISGILAGILSKNGRIGYVADYPICGMIANINAFAIGAKMVNPDARIYLEWTSVKDTEQILKEFKEKEVKYISCREMIIPNEHSRYFGLVNIENDVPENLMLTTWHWGVLYEKLIKTIQNGSWDNAGEDGTALNYWWGMSADVIDVISSNKVPQKTGELIEYIKQQIINGTLHPFKGVLTSQDGVVQTDENGQLSPEEIINMSWLADNVVGGFPQWKALNEEAKAIVEIQGVDKVEE